MIGHLDKSHITSCILYRDSCTLLSLIYNRQCNFSMLQMSCCIVKSKHNFRIRKLSFEDFECSFKLHKNVIIVKISILRFSWIKDHSGMHLSILESANSRDMQTSCTCFQNKAILCQEHDSNRMLAEETGSRMKNNNTSIRPEQFWGFSLFQTLQQTS